MADPFDFSQLGIPTPQVVPGPDPRIVSGGPASGIPPEMQPSSPRDQKDFEERVGGWERFFSTLANDRNLTNALLNFGSTTLQPRVGGQTQAGQIGRAIESGRQTYEGGRRADIQEGFQQTQLDQRDRQLDTNERQVDIQGRAVDSNIELRSTQIEGLREELKQSRESNPARMRLLEAQIDATIAQAERSKIGGTSGPLATANDIAASLLALPGNELTPAQAKLEAYDMLYGSAGGKTPQEQWTNAYASLMRSQANNLALLEDFNAVDGAMRQLATSITGFDPTGRSGAGTQPGATPPGDGENPARGDTGGVTGVSSVTRANRAWDANNGARLSPADQQRLIDAIKAQDPTGLAGWDPTRVRPLTPEQSNDVPEL